MSDREVVVTEDVAGAAAERLAAAVRPGAQIALAGGSTPRKAYEQVAALDLNWSGTELWLGDDRAVPEDHEHSNYRMVRESLGDVGTFHWIQGELGHERAADAYQAELEAMFHGTPRFDLILLGLGPDAHTASLFPGDSALGERERFAVGVETPGMAPLVSRVTLTLPVLNAGKEVVFLIAGEDKADAVARAFGDAAGPDAPASLVRPESGPTLLLDPPAAARLGAAGVRTVDADGAVGASPFPPIADYGFLSDCETTALVAPSGNVEWMCLPRLDSPSVFGSILDRDAGSFRLGPADVEVPAARRYLPGTMVLETSWGTRGGWIIVRDVLLIGPWHHEDERSTTHRRSPTDYDADHVLLRLVRCVNGEVQVNLDCEPVFDYGRAPAAWEYTGSGYHEAIGKGKGSDIELRLTSDMNLGVEGPRATARTMMKEGDTLFAALSWSEHRPPRSYDEAYERLVWTAHHWQHWLDHGEFPDHPWRSFLQRSALTLKGLSYAPTGAMVAAATTSLPETPQGERNWDYRYSWIRDATFTLWGLYTLGFDWEANDFFYFIADVAEAEEGQLQIMYGIDGEAELVEETLDHLSGYEGARPVRVGNGAYNQEQHDVWGAVLDSFYLHTKSRDHLPERIWPILVKQVEDALAHWHEPDRGLWEVRGEPKHFTSSKLMCWVALDRGARLAEIREDQEKAKEWQAVADEIKEDICNNALDDRGVFCQHYDTDELDASVLLMPLVRFLPPDDTRVMKTVTAIAEELTEDGLVLRYRAAETDDGLSGEEGTFTICSFWLVSALVEVGQLRQARALCEKLLSYASPLQLYAEEIDPRSGRHLGNFPQAFTHLALINAVMHVIRADEELEPSDFDRELSRTRHSR